MLQCSIFGISGQRPHVCPLFALCGLFVLLCRLLTAWLGTDREGHLREEALSPPTDQLY